MNGRPVSQVFDLYTSRAKLIANPPTEEILQRIIGVSGSASSTQLGLVDGKNNIITLRFPANVDGRHDRLEDEVEISLAQDLSGLRSRKGDTGEWPKVCFWKAILMARLICHRGWAMESKVCNLPSKLDPWIRK
jgi:hypothetical protein